MRYLKLSDAADIKFCSIAPARMKTQDEKTKWLSCSNFIADNGVVGEPTLTNYVPDESFAIHPEDIIIKRITPGYVNYISNISDDLYAGNNLIVLTVRDGVNAKYLAMILNDKIPSISESSSVGAVMKSVSRPDLEKIKIPLPPYEQQVKLGEVWFLNIELKKMKNRLSELECIKNNYELTRYINLTGGKNND